MRGAIDGVSARLAVARALDDPTLAPIRSQPLHVIAAGKAASSMASAIAAHPRLHIKTILAIGTHRDAAMPSHIEWHPSSHPLPDARSVTAARRALEVASAVSADECLIVLLSGGASAAMALPIDGLALEEKQATVRAMMLAGADIHALNTVRKHLSAIKGGRLAAACRGTTVTLAISDVVGDDLSIIGSGPGVADPSTWADAARALHRYGEHSDAVRTLVTRGLRGDLPETPKPGDLARTRALVIASRRHAIEAGRAAAEHLGYQVVTFHEDVTGEAREVAPQWFVRAMDTAGPITRPACVISAGETTVRVIGQGRGGRNQEFVLALVDAVAVGHRDALVASVGTDGIDGPTDAAGALVDRTTRNRAVILGLDPQAHLADNNAYDFFASLGDLIHLGPTDTNVGDLQILLANKA